MTGLASLRDVLDRLAHPKILVLGDLILDRYTFGNAERVSPEAPVLVMRADDQQVRLGGAASVAFLLKALEAEVTLAGVVGDDAPAKTLKSLVSDAHVDGRLVRTDPSRPTTVKERFVGRAADRHPHQLLRVDAESRESLGRDLELQLANEIVEVLREHDALLISDYAKGVCTVRLLAAVFTAARVAGIPSIVDPARIADYGRYQRATLVKPNRAEAELAANRRILDPCDALSAGQRLCRQHEFGAVLVTLDAEGMALVQDDDSQELFGTEPREVYDITGAGDMVLATLGLCLGSDLSLYESIRLANTAAGLEVERLGVAPITRQELATALVHPPLPLGEGRGEGVGGGRGDGSAESRREGAGEAQPDQNKLTTLPPVVAGLPTEPQPPTAGLPSVSKPPRAAEHAAKLTTLPDLLPLLAHYRLGNKTIIFTNGCFDLLHVGHVACLEQAAALGDILVVAVNSDASVRALKGAGRPIIPERDRATLIAALACVDHVLIFEEPTPHKLLEAIRPDILAKGATTSEIAGHEVVEAYGGQVRRVGQPGAAPNVSTTAIIAQIYTAHPPPEPHALPPPSLPLGEGRGAGLGEEQRETHESENPAPTARAGPTP